MGSDHLEFGISVDRLGLKQKNTAEKMRSSEVLTNYKSLWIMMITDTNHDNNDTIDHK